uniref:RNA-dependent RNA polymerase n=1 Tax=Anthurium amnicola TaxID=1678845 RepID=A0A1D1XGI4_9ARAE
MDRSIPRSSDDVALPASVEEKIGWICRDQGISPPEAPARRLLADLGEARSLEILRRISTSKVQKTFTAYVIYLAKSVASVPARSVRRNSMQEGAPPSGCAGSSPRKGDPPADKAHSSPSSFEMNLSPRASPELVALGELDFQKAFLILSYIGNKKLEEVISVNTIRELKTLPMSSFEAEIWTSFGQHYISDSERRHNHDWNSEKANLYHCYVDLDGRVTFKGPYLQQQRTHLQRVLGDENVLVVKFAGKERRENDLKQNFQHYSSVYKKLATEGLAVGLRLYQFFVFKDGGKEEKRKSPTSSPVKCYFVRIESLWAFDRDKPYILLGKPIQMARSIFMHVHKVSTISKYMPRFSLILSKTEKLEIDLGSVDIKQIDDIPCMDESGNIVYDEDGEWMIHTDGTGYISEDLALICPRNISKGHYPIPRDIQKIFDAFKLEDQHFPLEHWCSHVCPPPLLMQIRLFYNGRAIKGTLLVNRKLRPQTILIRPSMVKVEEDQCISSIHSANSLEIVGTSNLPRKATLSKHLIMHLHYGGVPRKFFLELLSNALVEAERACLDRRAALKVALRHADMDDYLAVRMILCGIPMDEPFLQFRLSVLMAEEKKGLKEGKLPISDCYYLMGTADPTGTLKSHEVCIILDKGQVSGDVLVYRNPGLHFGDVHVLTATYVKELENIVGNAKFAIFFSTQGPRSVAYEIANSDFDGDKYWVSMNKQLLCHFRPSTPWTATSFNKTKCPQMKPADYSTPEQLESKLFQLFLETRFIPSYSMSTSADSWLSFMDRLLTLGNDCEKEKQTLRDNMLKLVDIYYDALDAPKQGLKVEVPEDLRAEKYPHFLEKKYSYRSTSVLGEIFDTVNSSQTDSKKDIWKLSCFEDEVPHSMEIWWGRYLQYRKEMSKALSIESKEIKVAAANEVIQKYKRLLYDAAEFEDCTREREDVLDEALSIYHVSYDYAMQKNEVGKCSFAWNVAGQALCSLYSKRQGKGSIPCSVDVLREVMG